jgi:hypothetical protein
MKILLLLIVCLLSNILFSQVEEYNDSSEYYTEYHLLDYKEWTETIFEPTEENREWDRLTKVMYNPIVNYDALDSILKWRESKGYIPIMFDLHISDKKMVNNMSWVCMDISKIEKDKVTLGRFEDPYPECECVADIVDQILSDSTIYITGKKEIVFSKYLLTNRIKRIEIYYYQVSRQDDPEEKEEHLIVKIRRKFALFTLPYQIF